MKKKTLLTALSLLCLGCCAVGIAACGGGGGANDKLFEFRLQDDGTYALKNVSYNEIIKMPAEEIETLTIPSTYKGKPVTAIDPWSIQFGSAIQIKEIVLPDTLKEIGRIHTDSLEKIVIPDSVTVIHEIAFASERHLKSVTIGSGVRTIERSAFSDCTALTDLVVPDTVTEIQDMVFYGSGLVNLELPKGPVTFYGSPLDGAEHLETLTMSFPTRWFNRFHEDTQEWDEWDIENNRIDLNYICGNDLTSLRELTLKSGYAGYTSSSYFPSLRTVTLLDDVTEVAPVAFSYNEVLENVTIGKGVTALGDRTFFECNNIKNVTLHGFTFPNLNYHEPRPGEENPPKETLTLADLFPKTMPESGKTAEDITLTIGEGVTSVPQGAFDGFSRLKAIAIPASLTEYTNDHSVVEQTELETITVDPANPVFSCEDEVLYHIDEEGTPVPIFTNAAISGVVTIKSGVTYIPMTFFQYTAITGIVLPESVTLIRASAFAGCNGLTSVSLEHVVTIENSAFSQCENLETVTFGSDLALWHRAFYGCNRLTTINFGGSMEDWKSVLSVSASKTWDPFEGLSGYTVHCNNGTLDSTGAQIDG